MHGDRHLEIVDRSSNDSAHDVGNRRIAAASASAQRVGESGGLNAVVITLQIGPVHDPEKAGTHPVRRPAPRSRTRTRPGSVSCPITWFWLKFREADGRSVASEDQHPVRAVGRVPGADAPRPARPTPRLLRDATCSRSTTRPASRNWSQNHLPCKFTIRSEAGLRVFGGIAAHLIACGRQLGHNKSPD